MEWNETEKEYPIIKLQDEYEQGLSEWLAKIIDLALEVNGKYDVIIADLWPGDSDVRLIGHVQQGNEQIGKDTGFRVCAKISGKKIRGESHYLKDFEFLEEMLINAANMSPASEKLVAAHSKNPLSVHYTAYGEGPLHKTIPIWPFNT